MVGISLVLPSRGRPNGLLRLVESAWRLAENPDRVDVAVRIDADDPDRDYYTAVAGQLDPGGPPLIRLVVGPRLTYGYSGLWDEALGAAAGEILLLTGDDMVIRTPGWDRMIEEEFEKVPDRIALVYGADGGIADERMATHPAIHRRWVEAAGWCCPPLFAGDYIDLWLHETAEHLGRLRYLPDLLTDHIHPAAQKAPMDATYEDKIARMGDQRTFEVWDATEPLRFLCEQRLAAAIDAAR